MSTLSLTPTSTLPAIVEILGVKDHGPCDLGPTAVCPHCGADGRYVYTFRCADGTTRGAMRGCIQLFPKHRLAAVMEKVWHKRRDKQPLNRWDEVIVDAVNAWLAGQMDERTAIGIVNAQVAQRSAWIKRKYGR